MSAKLLHSDNGKKFKFGDAAVLSSEVFENEYGVVPSKIVSAKSLNNSDVLYNEDDNDNDDANDDSAKSRNQNVMEAVPADSF